MDGTKGVEPIQAWPFATPLHDRAPSGSIGFGDAVALGLSSRPAQVLIVLSIRKAGRSEGSTFGIYIQVALIGVPHVPR